MSTNISQRKLFASAKNNSSVINKTEQPHVIPKNQSTPKNARKIWVGSLDSNINVDNIYELFRLNTTAYL